ncbi:hypothetical protein ABZ545_32190 [Streptomyces abikoensis]|uniref:hypothetical protein n=1 Tax=Streptomyces abikoensis TaxID=97398 RepID=UPI0033EC7D2A
MDHSRSNAALRRLDLHVTSRRDAVVAIRCDGYMPAGGLAVVSRYRLALQVLYCLLQSGSELRIVLGRVFQGIR